jgi:hypothetical protein
VCIPTGLLELDLRVISVLDRNDRKSGRISERSSQKWNSLVARVRVSAESGAMGAIAIFSASGSIITDCRKEVALGKVRNAPESSISEIAWSETND